MRIELGGFEFSSEPSSRPGSLFMIDTKTGEGTEIDELQIAVWLRKLFEEAM